jgi:hypothetical protein
MGWCTGGAVDELLRLLTDLPSEDRGALLAGWLAQAKAIRRAIGLADH